GQGHHLAAERIEAGAGRQRPGGEAGPQQRLLAEDGFERQRHGHGAFGRDADRALGADRHRPLDHLLRHGHLHLPDRHLHHVAGLLAGRGERLVTPNHPWALVAPWYRWPRKKDGPPTKKPKDTAPVIQKFDTPKVAGLFTQEPQRSIKFVPSIDRVYDVVKNDAATHTGKLRDFFFAGVAYKLQRNDSTWKLFLPTHRRHYVVACELHCDAPGFPSVGPDKVCQSGFVVRRRRYVVPAGQQPKAVELLAKVVAARQALGELQQTQPPAGAMARRRFDQIKKAKTDGSYPALLQEAQKKLADALGALQGWKADSGVEALLEGWIPDAADNIGSWQPVEETPQELAERLHPLFRVFPDPKLPEHTATGRTLYFGVIPTSTLETTVRGEPALDDVGLYEVRCFVRRHKEECPRTDRVPDCHGELIWSRSSERFRLAPPADLLGTAQLPMTIK